MPRVMYLIGKQTSQKRPLDFKVTVVSTIWKTSKVINRNPGVKRKGLALK